MLFVLKGIPKKKLTKKKGGVQKKTLEKLKKDAMEYFENKDANKKSGKGSKSGQASDPKPI